ncbi:hypothetical protein PENFLA_c005G09306 [Penicillium flavigenum]|uniref:Uncharacterized protein n=1 Tax=Penicillium flavigenum TaxID=254877 RepID=A0A1V6TQ49_9EURO|nr:hypothetical protein PENFLA_c005G09306 [Penicillium flavigenum]
MQIKKLGCFLASGNASSFMFPECLPDKDHILGYFAQLSFIYDNIIDVSSSKETKEANKDLSHALELKNNRPGTSEMGKL